MKVLIFYRPQSEHSRMVETYIRDFQKTHPGQQVEVVNVDSPRGTSLVELYDIVQYPSIMVTQDDGVMQKFWLGEPLPLMDELASYARG